MTLIRMCVVPNCTQRLSRPILWIEIVLMSLNEHTVYVAVCVLMEGLTHFQLLPLFHYPPTPLYVPFVILQLL